MSDFKKLTDTLSVAAQLNSEDLSAAKAAGFKTIINNRPDNESDDQPSSAHMAKIAADLGIAYHHQPVIAGQISDQDVDDFTALLMNEVGPVLAFCRTGTRCTCLWALSQAPSEDIEAISQRAATAGYDISGLNTRLRQRKAV